MASAVSAQGQLRYRMRHHPFDSQAIIEYLEYLLESFKRKLLLIWDGASIHDSETVRKYLATKKQKELCLVRQPYYAPELNADEQVWTYLKQHKLKNTCNPTTKELKTKITAVMETLKKQPQMIRNFFLHPSLGYYN